MSNNALSLWDITHIAQRRAESLGVPITFDEHCDQPYYSLTEGIVFPRPSLPASEREMIVMRGSWIHEPLHVLRKISIKIFQSYPKNDPSLTDEFMYVWNMIEDDSMERTHAAIYEGDAQDLSTMYYLIAKENLAKYKEAAAKEGGELTLDADTTKMLALQTMLLLSRSDWDKKIDLIVTDYLEAIPTDSAALALKLEEEGYIDLMRKAVSQHQVHDLARELYNRVWPKSSELPPPPPEEAPDTGDEESKEGGSGEPPPPESGENQEDTKPPETAEVTELIDKIEGEEESRAVPVPTVIHWKDVMNSDKSGLDLEVPSTIDYTDKNKEGSWVPSRPSDREIINLEDDTHPYKHKEADQYLKGADICNSIGHQIRRNLQILTKSKVKSERKTGKVHNKNLFRLAAPQVGTGDWNSRIFKTRKKGLSLDACVTVLVDWSGSMGGEKRIIAAQAALALLHTFDKALSIPVEVLMFASRSRRMNFGIVKSYNSRTYTDHQIVQRISAFTPYAAGNQDADALLWAHSRLIKQKASRKILIVLSDGSPSMCARDNDGHMQDPEAGLRTVTKELRKKGSKIDLYGIGIQDKNVLRFYGDKAQVVNKLSELPTVLLTTIKQGVLSNG